MALTIGVPKESAVGERRVSIVPDVAARLAKQGLDVLVEPGAGGGAFHADAAYEAAGARIAPRADVLAADVVTMVVPPTPDVIAQLRPGGVLVGFLSPLDAPEIAEQLAERKVTGVSMELVPRISRAQKMDALSALSSIAGYRAVLLGAGMLPRFFPLLTTAAGTIRPANVLVLGAGVAGLQAIATARRLGARVSAYDIREAVREEVQSLGATFVELELSVEGAQDAGGYAKALEAEKARRQTELLVPHIGRSDVVITTALIPGRRAPVLITEEAVAAMAPGSVIVDLAAPNGGNCALTRPGETAEYGGVQIAAPLDLLSQASVDASQVYARTVMAFLLEFVDASGFRPNFDDEIFRSACVTHEGRIVNERVQGLLVK